MEEPAVEAILDARHEGEGILLIFDNAGRHTSMRRAVYTATTVARLTPITALFGKLEILTRCD
jgi:hypothetical protein